MGGMVEKRLQTTALGVSKILRTMRCLYLRNMIWYTKFDYNAHLSAPCMLVQYDKLAKQANINWNNNPGISLPLVQHGEEDRCLHMALPVAAFLEMLTKSVNLRSTAATRTGCVRHEVGHQMPFSGHGSRNAAEDLRPNILQLNTEGEQLAYKNKAFIIVLQETHCTTAR